MSAVSDLGHIWRGAADLTQPHVSRRSCRSASLCGPPPPHCIGRLCGTCTLQPPMPTASSTTVSFVRALLVPAADFLGVDRSSSSRPPARPPRPPLPSPCPPREPRPRSPRCHNGRRLCHRRCPARPGARAAGRGRRCRPAGARPGGRALHPPLPHVGAAHGRGGRGPRGRCQGRGTYTGHDESVQGGRGDGGAGSIVGRVWRVLLGFLRGWWGEGRVFGRGEGHTGQQWGGACGPGERPFLCGVGGWQGDGG